MINYKGISFPNVDSLIEYQIKIGELPENTGKIDSPAQWGTPLRYTVPDYPWEFQKVFCQADGVPSLDVAINNDERTA